MQSTVATIDRTDSYRFFPLTVNLCKTSTLKKTKTWLALLIIQGDTFCNTFKIFVLPIFEWPFYTSFFLLDIILKRAYVPEKLPPKTGSFSAEVVIGATTHYCYGSNTGGEKLLLRLIIG